MIVYCIPSIVYIGLALATVKQNINLAATLVWSPNNAEAEDLSG